MQWRFHLVPPQYNETMLDQVQSVVGPYAIRPTACRDYDPRAVVVARHIAALVSNHQVYAEHVGSTSVPGCAGKGIIDLMIPVPDGEMNKVKKLLDQLGFQHQTGQDPFPEDRPMRVGAWEYDGETFLLHVHVIPDNSPEVDGMRSRHHYFQCGRLADSNHIVDRMFGTSQSCQPQTHQHRLPEV